MSYESGDLVFSLNWEHVFNALEDAEFICPDDKFCTFDVRIEHVSKLAGNEHNEQGLGVAGGTEVGKCH